MYNYGDHEINYQKKISTVGLIFLSQNHIIWKEIWHQVNNFHVPFKASCELGQVH